MAYFGDYNGAYFAPYMGEDDPSVDLAESVNVAEALSAHLSISLNIPDVWEFGFGQGGPPPSYDPGSVTVAYSATQGVAEVVTLGETLVALLRSIVSKTEAVVVAEALATLTSYFASPHDLIAVGENIAAVTRALGSVTEGVATTEALAARYTASPAQVDAVALTEALSALSSSSVTLADNVAVAELIAASKAVAISLTDDAISTDEAILVMIACAQHLFEELDLEEDLDIVAHTTAVVVWIVATLAETLYAADVASDETLATTVTEDNAVRVSVTSSAQRRVPVLSASAQAAPEVSTYSKIVEITPTVTVEETDRAQPTIHPQMEFGDTQTTVSEPEGKE